ncbi:MAG TPA: cysteine--tRNA ligase [Acidimicrobiales bacterium]
MLRLFDTAKGDVVPFEPRELGKVSMYVCGPTVYGPPHLGHGRFALVFDVLRRYLMWRGDDVTYVSNITDIDDRIIDRAQREQRDWHDIAERCEAVWYRAMDALGVMRPDHDPHATAYVEQMVDLIGRLMERGAAYETSDGVYFQADRVDDYGLLARQPLDTLKAGARVEATGEKRSPVDFVLWKKAKPGEPTWPSPWGDGRPGWHTECVVMSLDLLDEGFDIHGGGQDLAFPHHENERAQAVADGRRFARTWVHNGFVEVEGTKMSKSLGNVTNLLDLVEAYDPRAYRLLVLRSHYRSPMDVTDDSLRDAEAALERLDAFARRVAGTPAWSEREGAPAPDAESMDRFRDAMDDDLQTPAATGLLFDLVRRANAALDAGDDAAVGPLVAAVREITGALGLVVSGEAGEVPAELLDLARQRDEARAARDWPTADALRDRIQAAGYVVEDTPGGTVVRPA